MNYPVITLIDNLCFNFVLIIDEYMLLENFESGKVVIRLFFFFHLKDNENLNLIIPVFQIPAIISNTFFLKQQAAFFYSVRI